ncbi:MAG: hypothetical protein WBC54_06835, partial [Rhodococcus sp. (in: high G+C Gram-positive bacteria)]
PACGLDLVLGRERPAFAGHEDILPAEPVVLLARCPLSGGNLTDGSGICGFEGGYAFALFIDHGYVAYRIPVEDDHTLMTPGKTDYLYDNAGVRMPAWRITLSLAERPMLAAFDAGRDTVSAELDAMEQSDRQGSAA